MVLYTPNTRLQAARPPSGFDLSAILPAVTIGFRPFLSIPSAFSHAYRQLGLNERDRDAYDDLCYAIRVESGRGQPKHQLLGYSDNIQGDMPLSANSPPTASIVATHPGTKTPKPHN